MNFINDLEFYFTATIGVTQCSFSIHFSAPRLSADPGKQDEGLLQMVRGGGNGRLSKLIRKVAAKSHSAQANPAP